MRSGLVAALCATLAACGPPADERAVPTRGTGTGIVALTDEGIANAEIRTTPLLPTTFGARLHVAATIGADPQRIAEVGARVPGRIAVLSVALGDQVVRGQPLVEIDALELHQVVLEYFVATARAREARDALARQQQLVAERVGAERDLRRTEADAAAATAALRESEEHLHFLGLTDRDIARLRARTTHGEARTVVRAPIDGRVDRLDVALGQVLTGTENVVTVVDLTTVTADLRVYERDLGSVARGAPVEVQVPTYPGRTFTGQLEFVGELVDPVTRTVQARASLANADGALRPGMTATVSVVVARSASDLWLPAGAVQPHEGGLVAFVREGPRRFAARAITVGPDEGGFVPVRSGLAAGDDVVVHGAFALRAELERADLEE